MTDISVDIETLGIDVDVINDNEIEVSVFGALVQTEPAFVQIDIAGQDSILATQGQDILTFIEGTNVTLTTDAISKTITINASLSNVDGGEVV